jgi:multimeric flavodoxin WrbA
MKTLILCDRESTEYNSLDLCSQVKAAVVKAGSDVNTVVLNGDEIRPCLGCFKCWVKTPGLCIMADDCANAIAGQEIQSDVLIILSKMCYGGYSYDIKSFLDRSIPNISPFFETVNDEMHHKMRYERFPYMITIGYGTCTPQERQTFISLAERNALNMKPPKHFLFIMQNAEEINETMRSLSDVLSQEVCQ